MTTTKQNPHKLRCPVCGGGRLRRDSRLRRGIVVWVCKGCAFLFTIQAGKIAPIPPVGKVNDPEYVRPSGETVSQLQIKE